MKRFTFLFSIMAILLVSSVIATPAKAAVSVAGSWGTGTSHTKASGSDRALIFIAYGETASAMNVTSVSYGGQAMTKVLDNSSGDTYAYAAAFILNEAGVAAASGSSFSVTWSGSTPGGVGYASVFLSGVNQTTLIGATGSGAATSNRTVTTSSSLATNNGDMVILGAMCGNSGSYTVNNGFTEGTDQTLSNNSATGVTGHLSATGSNVTPSATYSSTSNRQTIIGLVVKAASGGTTTTTTTSSTTTTTAASTTTTTSGGIEDVWLEAECGNVGSLWNVNSDSSASGGEYVTIQSGNNSTGSAPSNSAGHITFPFSVGTSDTYIVWGRIIAPNGNDDSFWVRMDSGSWYQWNNLSTHTSWTWDDVHDSQSGGQVVSFNLSSGSHTLTIAYREDGTRLDKIYITNSGDTPSGTGGEATNCGGSTTTTTSSTTTTTTSSTTTTTTSSTTTTTTASTTTTTTSGTATTVSINCGGSATGDFVADQYYSGGNTYTISRTIDTSQITGDVPPQAVLQSERYNESTYTIPNFQAGSIQTVTLYFVEAYVSGSGDRIFDVAINGTTVLDNFDIYAEAGGQDIAIARTFSTTANSSGQVVIHFIPGSIQNPKICGISVTGSSGPVLSVSPTSIGLAAAAGSSGTFNITSNTDWTVSDNQTWLSESPTSGSDNGTVTVTAQENTGDLSRAATVTVTPVGTTSKTVTVTQSGVGIGCDVPPMPSFSSLPTNAKFPDPFTFMDGTPVTTVEDWECRRAEIAELIQEFESGYKPDTPYSATTASLNGNTLTVTVNDNGHQISFNCSISKPSGSGPFPMLITVGGSSLGSVSSLGVATINLPNDDIAAQSSASSRGQGKFYTMYGSNHSASAMMAWAWGASRLIDAVEKTPSTGLDPTRIGVTGCSRNGKGALMCGAFDDRIDLVIPQESGSGGSASWRVSEYMHDTLGQDTQELCEICGENVWFRANFDQFCGNEGKLPTDHHELIGLVAPRAIYIIDNDILWLGPESSWNCANAAKQIWIALGVPDKFGYSCTTGHTHCSFPSSQQTERNAYIQKYLVGGGTGTTGIMRNDPGYTYDQARWVNWSTPNLQ